jgi:hypothetical protein
LYRTGLRLNVRISLDPILIREHRRTAETHLVVKRIQRLQSAGAHWRKISARLRLICELREGCVLAGGKLLLCSGVTGLILRLSTYKRDASADNDWPSS